MAKKKKGYQYNGLGFPVILVGFEFEEAFGEKLPKLNHRKLEETVFKALLDSKIRLSGSQLAFVRKFMGLTQQQFAIELGMQSHARISQWESKKENITGMS